MSVLHPKDRRSHDEAHRQEIRRELAAHVAERVDELMVSGVPRHEAERQAAAEFGDAAAAEQAMTAMAARVSRTGALRRVLGALAHDLRAALRGLRRQPGFSGVAILAIAAGVGATTAIFSVVDGVLLRPLNYDDPSQIVTLWSATPSGSRATPSYPDFRDWQEQSTSFTAMAFIRGGTFNHLDDDRGAALLRTALVTSEFVEAVRAPTHLGTLSPLADPSPPEPVIALKYATWLSRFGGDPSVVGRMEPFSDGLYRVVAVLGRGVDYPLWADAYAPLTQALVESEGLDVRQYRLDNRVVARVDPNTSFDAARSELALIGARLTERYPESNARSGVALQPLRELLVGDVRTSLLVLLTGVTALLLIACANVASLSLARTLDRTRELGVRAALGAARGRLAGQLMVEGLVVAVLGGLVGVVLARWGVDTFLSWGVPGLPRSQEIEVDGRILMFAVATACTAGVLSSLIPALLGSRTSFMSGLKGGRPARTSELLRGGLVAGQVAVTVALLAATGLLARSLITLQGVDTGFDPSALVTLRMNLPASYQGRPAERHALYQRILEDARSKPSIAEATLVNHVPLAGTGAMTPVLGEGMENASSAWLRTTGPDYFGVLGLPLVAGRDFEAADHQSWSGGLVISEALAKQLWGDQDPLGKRMVLVRQLASDPDYGQPIRGAVIGVAANTRTVLRATGPTQAVYLPMSAHAWTSAYLVVRPRPGLSVVEDIRRAVVDAEPQIPVADVVPLAELAQLSVSRDRFLATLSVVFSVVAVFLAFTGTYGVLSYTVRQRSRDVAVQVALGSGRGRVVRSVLRRAGVMVGSGVAAGVVTALVLTRFMGSLLYQVSPMDPLAFAGSVLVVFAMGVVGAWIPARRAARVDPMMLLRE